MEYKGVDSGTLAERLKVPKKKVEELMKYMKANPHDFMQPSDPMFEKVWGKQTEAQANRAEKEKSNIILPNG